MIGNLPKAFEVNGKVIDIQSDYRMVLTVFEALNEPDFSEDEKQQIVLECFINDYEKINLDDIAPLMEKISWFLSGGDELQEESSKFEKKVLDWSQDQSLIFSVVNKVAHREVRECEYMHWWTFLGYFKERGECLLNTIINIRDKINRRKRLTKDEEEFYRLNKSMIDLRQLLTAEEKAEIDHYNNLPGMNRR